MSRGFGATFGSASTDIITTTYTANAAALTSYSFWMKMNSSIGAGTFPRVFQKDASTNNTQCIYWDQAAARLTFQYPWSPTVGAWAAGAPFDATDGLWHHIVLTYDNSSTFNAPAIFIDGAAGSVNGLIAPATVVATNSDPYTIGNRSNGQNRAWDGLIAEFAVWEGILLTAGEVLSLKRGLNPSRVRPVALKHYLPLYGLASPEPDLSGNKNNGTVTGTALAFGPPILPFTPRWVSPSLALPMAGLDWVIHRRNKLRIEGKR